MMVLPYVYYKLHFAANFMDKGLVLEIKQEKNISL